MFTSAPVGEVKPLSMLGKNNVVDEVISTNLTATMEREYDLMQLGAEEGKGLVSIVGAGPSLAFTYKDISGDIIACNSAHDFLIGKGIVPRYAMLWDAHAVIAKVFTPHKDVTYLVGSRCHPDVFTKLEGYKVKVFHVLGDAQIEDHLLRYKKNEPMIGGGSSSATRAAYVAGALGYQGAMHFFGVDSSYANDEETHVSGSVVEQKKMKLRCCGEWFLVAPWMAMQAGDFKLLIPHLEARGFKIIIHGTGLVPYTATFLGVETPDIKISRYEKLRREVHAFILLFLQIRNSPQLLGGSHAGI